MTDDTSSILTARVNSLMLVLGPALVLLLAGLLSMWSGAAEFGRTIDLADTLLRNLPWVIGWLGAAAGFGWPLRRMLLPATASPRTMQFMLGFIVMMFLARTLGSLGWLQTNVVAWSVPAIGWTLLLVQNRRMLSPNVRIIQPVHWLFWFAIPGLAVLLVASASAPGWLWATEFGGYDALSYHLQLPKEWFNLGSAQPLEHNIYSFLPSYMESVYYHYFVLRSNSLDAAYCCQLLHASLALACAAAVYGFVKRIVGDIAGIVAAVLLLGTPWIIVTGSLAYNDLVPVAMLAAGLLLLAENHAPNFRTVIALALFIAAACSAKLTAIGFVGVPLGLLLLLQLPPRRWVAAAGVGLAVGVLCLSPYFISNTIATGNPVFPFASAIFGNGHWTTEQLETWREAHGPPDRIPARLAAAWNEWMRYGIGANPNEAEPWKPQWSLLPLIGLLGLLLSAAITKMREQRQWSWRLLVVVGIQLLFWVTLTHIKSRFMLPSAAPLAIGAGLGIGSVATSLRGRRSLRIVCLVGLVLLAAWSVTPVMMYRSESKANLGPAFAIGMVSRRDGSSLTEIEHITYGRSHSPAIFANYVLGGQANLLLIGEAAPFYFTRRNVSYSTVWDRGVASEIVREHPNDPEAWVEALRNRGYTHVYIDGAMMDRWAAESWQDPELSADAWIEALTRYGRIAVRYDERRWFFRIDEQAAR